MKRLAKKNNKLKNKCVEIFGDFVKNAFVTSYDDRDAGNYSVCLSELNGERIYLEDVQDGACIDYDSSIIIEFTNGNFVRFTNSEWADITKLNDVKALYEFL